MHRLEGDQHDLLELLDTFRFSKVSNLRDKVYGLLALVEEETEASAICVDYNKGVGAIYANTVLLMIRLYSQLTPLAYVDHGPDYLMKEGFTS